MKEKIERFFRSPRLALLLLLAAAALAVLGTLFAPGRAESLYRSLLGLKLLPAARFLGLVDTYRSPLFLGIIFTLCLNIIYCTWHRIFLRRGTGHTGRSAARRRWRRVLDAAMHLSILLVIAGGTAKGLWGFTRTSNVHVGQSIDVVYDFDIGAEVPLGFTLQVVEREDTYYPLQVRIGVSDLATGEKISLLEVQEGREAGLPGRDLTLKVAGFDRAADLLHLEATSGGRTGAVELTSITGEQTSSEFGPFALTLVAHRQDLKKVRSLVAVIEKGHPAKEGWISPNERMSFRGVSFSLTAWGTDPYGYEFVGIQVVREPGAVLFWGGCSVFSLLLPVFLAIRVRRPDRE